MSLNSYSTRTAFKITHLVVSANICSTPPDDRIKVKEAPTYFSLFFTKHKKFQNTEQSASIMREEEVVKEEEEEGEENENEFHKILFEQGMGTRYGDLSL